MARSEDGTSWRSNLYMLSESNVYINEKKRKNTYESAPFGFQPKKVQDLSIRQKKKNITLLSCHSILFKFILKAEKNKKYDVSKLYKKYTAFNFDKFLRVIHQRKHFLCSSKCKQCSITQIVDVIYLSCTIKPVFKTYSSESCDLFLSLKLFQCFRHGLLTI